MKKRVLSLLLAAAMLLLPITALAEEEKNEAKPGATPEATATATPAPSPTPLPTPTPTLTPNDSPWFDHSALLGDSVSDGLRAYAEQKRKKDDPGFLGNMQFLTKVSYSLSYASANNTKKLVKYQGKSMRPEEALNAMGANKVFIMLGINDIFHDEQENRTKYSKLIDNIRSKNPNIKIGIVAITPIVTEGQYSAFQNKRVNEYNEYIKNLSNEKHCEYIDFNDQLRDKTGGLKESYSRDQFVHLRGAAFEIYAAALSKAAQYMSR